MGSEMCIRDRYYGDGSRWKEIAAANGMTEDDLTGGERLVIPD